MAIRPIGMYKTMVGWSEFRSGDEKHAPTHRLLSDDEWNQINKYVDSLQSKIRTKDQLLHDKDVEIRRIKEQYELALMEVKKKAAEDIAVAQSEVVRQKGLNENLLRISRERSNARRGLQPKKKHSGYRYVGKITQIKVVRDRTKTKGNIFTTAWTVTLETPYDVTLPLSVIQDRINEDLFKSDGICERMNLRYLMYTDATGKTAIWVGEYTEAIERLKDGSTTNYIYDIKYSGNPKSKLWEVQIYTINEIEPLADFF